jgi:hypothetical protein
VPCLKTCLLAGFLAFNPTHAFSQTGLTTATGHELAIGVAAYKWSAGSEFVHWTVGASPVNDEIVAFTVGSITVQQRLGAYEPLNTTNELLAHLGFRF